MKVISLAPTRISLMGGGTDISPYCDLYGGVVINMAINLRSRFTLFTGNDLFDPEAKNTVPPLGKKEFVYAFRKEFGLNDMHLSMFKSEFDGILESGIGSSASSAVAIIGAINKYKDLGLSKEEIAEKAWEIEVNQLKLYGGKQDQYASSLGGANIMFFTKERVEVQPLPRKSIEKLLPSLVLFYTGKNRQSAKIQEGFKKLTKDQFWALNWLKKIAIDAIGPITRGNFRKIGALLDEAWGIKKLSNKNVTNNVIDNIYSFAKANGALGGKILGAGGGGYMLFIVPPEDKDKFISEMENGPEIKHWDFDISWSGLETRILPR